MKLSVTFSLDRHTSVPAPHVRIWLDTDASGVLSDDEELRLSQNGLVWKGSAEAALSTTDGVILLAKYIGSPGATATIIVESDEPEDHKVFEDSRKLKNVQGSVVGLLGK